MNKKTNNPFSSTIFDDELLNLKENYKECIELLGK